MYKSILRITHVCKESLKCIGRTIWQRSEMRNLVISVIFVRNNRMEIIWKEYISQHMKNLSNQKKYTRFLIKKIRDDADSNYRRESAESHGRLSGGNNTKGNNTKDNNYGLKEEQFSRIRLLGISWLTNALVLPRWNIRQLARIFRLKEIKPRFCISTEDQRLRS